VFLKKYRLGINELKKLTIRIFFSENEAEIL
jgi:hypothetical protein